MKPNTHLDTAKFDPEDNHPHRQLNLILKPNKYPPR